jgi:hypothetical protein
MDFLCTFRNQIFDDPDDWQQEVQEVQGGNEPLPDFFKLSDRQLHVYTHIGQAVFMGKLLQQMDQSEICRRHPMEWMPGDWTLKANVVASILSQWRSIRVRPFDVQDKLFFTLRDVLTELKL